MYEQMYNKAIFENADIVMCDLFYNSPGDPKSYYGAESPRDLTSRSILASCMCAQSPILHCFLVNKLVKSEIYRTVEWPREISRYEDIIACSQILRNPLKIGYLNQAFYHYFQRDGSLVHRQYTKKEVENDYRIIQFLYRYLCSSKDAELEHYWQSFVPVMMMSALRARERIYSSKEYAARYKKYRNCVWKNNYLHASAKLFLYIATYNYYLAHSLFQAGRNIKAVFRQIE